jgi:hypothetical protein
MPCSEEGDMVPASQDQQAHLTLRLDIRAEFLARPELFAARPELSLARGRGRSSRAHFSGPSRAFGSPGSARSSPKARQIFFFEFTEKPREKEWAVFWPMSRSDEGDRSRTGRPSSHRFVLQAQRRTRRRQPGRRPAPNPARKKTVRRSCRHSRRPPSLPSPPTSAVLASAI